jgi:rSAM/selenodomain-associated transferase 1
VVVFAKTPTPGEVKTRLTPVLHAREAADLARALLLDTVRAGEKAGLETVVAFTPSTGRRPLERLMGRQRRLVAQGGGDLGTRLARVMAQLAGERPRPVIVLGTDCPAVTPARLSEAWAELARRDVVLGPALDGGFYLIGLRRSRPELLEGVPWSTAETMAAVEARARDAGLTVGRLAAERDLDTPEDLYEWYAGAQAARLGETYPQTWATLHALLPPRRLAALEAAVRGEPFE